MSNFRKHIKLHRSLLNKNCPYCEKQIKGYNLTRHIKRKHGSNMKGSAIIEDTVSNIVEANWDEQISSEQELMRDVSCDDYSEMHRPGENEMISGTDNQTLVTDTAMSIDDDLYCNLEGDKMTDEGIQLIPLQSIANRTQFICDECNYRAGSRYNLTRHKESLHTVKVGSCPHLFCNEKFPSKFTMKVHLANCFLYCNWYNCDKKYKNKKLFDKHQAGHADKLRRMI